MSEFLHFSEHTLQEVALVIMALVYTTRLWWFFRFKLGGDRQPQTGDPDKTPERGGSYSLTIVARPWAMESSRSKPFHYLQFTIFHIGVVVAIVMSFLIPYLPGTIDSPAAIRTLQVFTGAACLVGVIRFIRRVGDKHLRAISSPDDVFSLVLLTVWFFFATMAAPNNWQETEFWLLGYFLLTAFFLLYVPFSKISHYLYYPFTRYWLGRSLGHRGVLPFTKGQ